MNKKIDHDAFDDILSGAQHITNKKPIHDITKKKKKEIQYSEYLETELFNKKIKDIKYHGTWQGFIRDAIKEKIDSMID